MLTGVGAWRDACAVGDEQSLFVFLVSGVALAIRARDIAAISAVDQPTPVPGVPDHVLGLVASGERVVAQVDLASLLGLADADGFVGVDPLFRRTMFVSSGDFEAALVCHRARGLVTVDSSAVREPAVLQGPKLRPFLAAELEDRHGVVGLLDLPALLRAASVS